MNIVCNHCSCVHYFLSAQGACSFYELWNGQLLGMRWLDFFSCQFVLHSQLAHECIPIVGRQLGYRCGAAHALAGGLILTSQRLVVYRNNEHQ